MRTTPYAFALLSVAAGLVGGHSGAEPSRGAAYPSFQGARLAGARNPVHVPSHPRLIRLRAEGAPVYVWQAGAYHWIPRRRLVAAMGYRDSAAAWEAKAPGPIGHPMDFFYEPGGKTGYWYHDGRLYPVKAYVMSVWIDWGHTIDRLPFSVVNRPVEIARGGHVIRLAKAHSNPLTTATEYGVTFRYPKGWIREGQTPLYLFEAKGPAGNADITLNVYPQSDRSPSSPLWFLGKFRVLPDDAKTWPNGQGGIEYQASVQGGSTTIGVVQPMPNHAVGYAFRLAMTVPSSRVTWAWTVLNTWRLGGVSNTAVLTGDTNAHGDPVFRVTLVGPKGRVTTTASLDTGDEGGVLINPALARAIGLVQVGRTLEEGVGGPGHASEQPIYQGLSVAPAGTRNWMLYHGSARGWGLPGIDLGTDFLRHASETDSDGHWTITWAVP